MRGGLLKLQNGTDIRAVLMQNDDREINLTMDGVRAIARGILYWLTKNDLSRAKSQRIAIGTDSRVTGEQVKSLLTEEFMKWGASVVDCAMATTPAMFMTTVWEDYDCSCAIMVTASHLPYYYNGFKLFTQNGGVEKSDIHRILTYAEELYDEEDDFDKSLQGSLKKADLIEDYSHTIVKNIIQKTDMSKPLQGLKILVDAGNGAGGFFANQVIKMLGADIEGSQFLEPDGMFPNHPPNPENKEAMRSVSEAVLKHQADLGIIFDTDVDRAALVTSDGQEINRNSLIAMIADVVLREHPGSIVVTDSVTSDGLTEFITRRGGKHHRFKRGYKNVINEAKRINEAGEGKACLAIETSGHGALEENYFLDDGSYLIAKLLIESAKLSREGKSLQSLIEDLKHPAEEAEYRLKIKKDDFKEYGERALVDFEKFAIDKGWEIEEPNYEGIKARTSAGWILIRMSLHEPVMPINIETNVQGAMKDIVEALKEFVKEHDGLEF